MTDDDSLAIRTPDQRLRVFVSSTLAELAAERAVVARSITALRLTPVMFEMGARPHPPQELYRAYLAQSDIFIGLYWQRYGWVGPDMDISGLEDEFRLSGGLPRLMYLKSPAPDREPRLTAMIGEIESRGTDAYRTFTSTRELGRLVRDDLALLLSERFAMGHAARPATPPRPAMPAPRRSLPATPTSLIGRADDVVAVVDLLRAPEVRLVTLTGPGGIGKTRLAIAVGEALSEPSPSPPLFASLASIWDADLALRHVAELVGTTIEGNRRALDAIVEQLGDTSRVLILDNLEQVIDVAPQLDELLMSCPGVKILATSRTVLRLRAEREYVVGALAVPATMDQPSVDEAALLPAVQLFVERAQAVRRGFALDDANVAAVVDICRRLDGLPLAIELAAARTRLLDPASLHARLERVLDALGSGAIDLPERQRTLRATVEWSMDLLGDAERQMLSTLSVFSDGWTLAAATSVSELSEDDTLDLLDALAGHSLVGVDAAAAEPRFRMLTSVRELAAERAAATDAAARSAARHASYFASLVETEWPAERQTEWADRVRADEQNIRTAVRWFFTHDVTRLPHLFRALWLFWQMSDRMPEARAWIGELQAGDEPMDERARAEVLFTRAVTAAEVGDDTEALAAMRGIELLPPPEDDPYLASSLQLARSWTLPIVDDVDGALAAASSALAGFRAQQKPFVAFATLTVGMLAMTLGRTDTARQHLVEVEQLGHRFGNTWLLSTGRSQLASLAVATGELEEARAKLSATMDSIEHTHVSTLTVTFALVALAQLSLATGDHRRAAIALGALDELRRRAGLLAWPLTRRDEAALRARLAQTAAPEVVHDGRGAGAAMRLRDAIAFLRQSVSA